MGAVPPFTYVVPPGHGGGGGGGNVTGPASAVANDIATFNGTTGKIIKDGGSTIAQVIATAIAGSGNVTGPAGATDGFVALYNGVTGHLIKDSVAAQGNIFDLLVTDQLWLTDQTSNGVLLASLGHGFLKLLKGDSSNTADLECNGLAVDGILTVATGIINQFASVSLLISGGQVQVKDYPQTNFVNFSALNIIANGVFQVGATPGINTAITTAALVGKTITVTGGIITSFA